MQVPVEACPVSVVADDDVYAVYWVFAGFGDDAVGGGKDFGSFRGG